MRWLGFAICAGLALTLQTTVAWRLEIRGARPDWMLVLAVFFVLHARTLDALIGAWLLGALMDNYSMARFGLLSGCSLLRKRRTTRSAARSPAPVPPPRLQSCPPPRSVQ